MAVLFPKMCIMGGLFPQYFLISHSLFRGGGIDFVIFFLWSHNISLFSYFPKYFLFIFLQFPLFAEHFHHFPFYLRSQTIPIIHIHLISTIVLRCFHDKIKLHNFFKIVEAATKFEIVQRQFKALKGTINPIRVHCSTH